MPLSNDNYRMFLPVDVRVGPEALSALPAVLEGIGTRLLLVTAPELAKAESRVREQLGPNILVSSIYLQSPEPNCAFIDETAAGLRGQQFDAVLGLGGGSAIDVAKSLAIALTHTHPIWDYANLSYRAPRALERPVLPILAVPTTAGTGSEVTPYAVLTNDAIAQKGTVQQPEIFPRAGFIEPALTCTMPAGLTASTGIDALAHALESCINVSKPAPFAQIVGKEAIQLIFGALRGAVREPKNLDYRSSMAWGSTLAGMAIAHRGTTVPHAIAEALGALTHLPHAVAVSLALVPVLKRTWRSTEALFRELHMLVMPGDSARDGAERFVMDVEQLIQDVGLRSTAIERLRGQSIDGLAEQVLKNVLEIRYRPLKQHPIQYQPGELAEMIHEVIG